MQAQGSPWARPRRRARIAPGSCRARYALSANVSCLPRGDRQARRALPALLERHAFHRAARFASASAPRSSTTSAMASFHRRRWPTRRRSAGRGRWRGSRTDRRARSCTGSNIPTAPSSPGRSRAGWPAPASTSWPTPIFSRRCRCTRLRLWRRRFNQAAALTTEISRQTGKPCDLAALRRVKATRSQVGLSRAQRAENVQGAFRLAEGAAVRGLNVVLVDDVLTSGATANAASRAVLAGGAKRVDVLVFARVVTGG